MSMHAKKAIIAGPQAVDPGADAPGGQEMSAKTATKLRDLCERTSEPFDGNLTETQAQRRMAALREIHGMSS